ncbi:hypothetical protein EGW08_016630 [Elysia chlorotica]|uniref:G-protein coupled receptors family 1 profile domain-containing protein n=1 Tax=Elysia chlorotica TaxID=188477 RepID=A0A433T1Y2_ELYCH|nr:hypothetical protein EGW08_016630 [Elysia chlorotica]
MDLSNIYTTEPSSTGLFSNVTYEDFDKEESGPINSEGKRKKWIYVAFTLACLVVAIFVLTCNIIFVAACWRTRSLRTLSTLFVISLAGSDMFQAVGMILQALFYANIWIDAVLWTASLCPWIKVVFLTCVPISMMSVAFVAIDRYIYIIFPYRYPHVMTARRSTTAIALVWVTWVAFGFSTLYHKHEGPSCMVTMAVQAAYIWTRLVVFVISAAVSGFCHVSIQLVAVKQLRKVHSCANTARISNRNASATTPQGITITSLRLVKTFFLIYVSHLVCWTPALVTPIFRLQAKGVTNLFYILAEFSAAINVIVYIYSNAQFRRAIVRLIRCLPKFSSFDQKAWD